MMIKYRIYTLLLLGAVVLLYGCSSSQNIQLSGDGSGKAEISVSLSSLVIQYAEDIAGGFSGNKGDGDLQIFDAEIIQSKLLSLRGVDNAEILERGRGQLKISFSFDRIEDVLSDSAVQPSVFDFRKDGDLKILTVTLTADNFSSVADFLGLGNNEIMDTFGPQKDDPFSEKEYLQMAEYLFDEYASRSVIDSVLKKSVIDINISVDGVLRAVDAESPVSASFKGRSGNIKIPLLTALTLSKPVKMRIIWR